MVCKFSTCSHPGKTWVKAKNKRGKGRDLTSVPGLLCRLATVSCDPHSSPGLWEQSAFHRGDTEVQGLGVTHHGWWNLDENPCPSNFKAQTHSTDPEHGAWESQLLEPSPR
jgi:hypothetical protein